jgi:hypothetical protein
MGSSYGRRVLSTSGREIGAAASMSAHWKTGGVTMAWGTVAAAGADVKLPDDTPVKAGQKYLRFGQILCRITQHEVETLTVNGSPAGGSFSLTYIDEEGESHETGAIAFDASAAAVEAALEAVGAEVTVTKASNVYTVTFDDPRNVAALVLTDNDLTGGTSPTVAVATSTQGTADLGKYGPYDPAATDGRQLLTRGECFILNKTVLETGIAGGFDAGVTDHPAVFDGGPTWKARVLMTTGTHSLAAGPTVTEFETAFPRVEYVQDK